MKKLFSILAILLVGFFAFTSCDSEEETDAGETPTATIQGYLYADLDLSNTGNEAVTNEKIYFYINSQDLVEAPIAGYDYKTLQYSATTNADGYYSITLPAAKHAAVAVTVEPNDFEYEQVQADDTEERMYYEGIQEGVNIRANEDFYEDISYNAITPDF